MGYQSAKKALNAYPHTSTEASGHFPIESRSVNPKNVRNWAQNWPQRPPWSLLCNAVNWHSIKVVLNIYKNFVPRFAFLAPKIHFLAELA